MLFIFGWHFYKRSSPRSPFCTPPRVRTISSVRFHLLVKLSSFNADASGSWASSSWRYSIVTFSSIKMLDCEMSQVLYLNLINTSLWSESLFAPRFHVDNVGAALIDLVAGVAVWRVPGFEVAVSVCLIPHPPSFFKQAEHAWYLASLGFNLVHLITWSDRTF
jgi:hypothetical protein